MIIHDIMRKPNSIIVLLYIFHIIHPQKQKRSVQPFCFWGEHSKELSNQADVELDMINAISATDIAFIMSSSQAIENWLNALDQSDFSNRAWRIIILFIYKEVQYYLCFATPLIYCETQKTISTLIWLWQVNCVQLTNHNKSQEMRKNLKQQTNYCCCLRFLFSCLICFFLTVQWHSRSISSVHSFPRP